MIRFSDLDGSCQSLLELRQRIYPGFMWVAFAKGPDGKPQVQGYGDEDITLLEGWWKVHISDIEGAP